MTQGFMFFIVLLPAVQKERGYKLHFRDQETEDERSEVTPLLEAKVFQSPHVPAMILCSYSF